MSYFEHIKEAIEHDLKYNNLNPVFEVLLTQPLFEEVVDYLADYPDREAMASAYDDGYREGQEEGYGEGFKEGKDEGFEQGDESGYAIGYATGYQEGYDKAQAEFLEVKEKEDA